MISINVENTHFEDKYKTAIIMLLEMFFCRTLFLISIPS